MNPPTFNDISIAREFVGQYLPKTPLVRVEKLSEILGCDYYAKLENLQPVGAFKVRGGVNLVGTATDEEKNAGMISASTGNHGQSIAYAGRLFGVRVIAAQSERAPAMWHAWHNRTLTAFPTMETKHEGLATRVPFEMTNKILWDFLDDFALVSDEAIDAAIRLLAQHAKQVAEGAGAASLAAAIKLGDQLRGKKVVGILTGGNIPPDRFAATII